MLNAFGRGIQEANNILMNMVRKLHEYESCYFSMNARFLWLNKFALVFSKQNYRSSYDTRYKSVYRVFTLYPLNRFGIHTCWWMMVVRMTSNILSSNSFLFSFPKRQWSAHFFWESAINFRSFIIGYDVQYLHQYSDLKWTFFKKGDNNNDISIHLICQWTMKP